MADQRARIQIRNHRDAVPAQKLAGLFARAPITGNARKLTHHQALDIGPRRFIVGGVGAVIPDLRVGQNDDLAGVGWIREDFLIAGNGSNENKFAGSLGGRTKPPALEDRTVFQGQDGGWQLDSPPRDWIASILTGLYPRRVQ